MLKLILIFLAIFYNTNIFSKDVQKKLKKNFVKIIQLFLKNININLYPKNIYKNKKQNHGI